MATLPTTSRPTATAGEWARPAIRSPAGTPRRPATPARRAPAPVRASGDDADENLARRASVGPIAADRGVQRRAAAGRTVLAGRNPPSRRSCTPKSSSFSDAFVPPPNAVHGPRCPPTYQETVLPFSLPSPRRFLPLAAAGALTALTLAACGSSGSSGSTTASSTSSAPAPAPATSGSPTAAHNAADVNFAELMIPHHQQAIEMATLAGTRAANGQVKTIAERVRAAQGPEITTMTGWLTSWGQPTAVPSTTARPMGSTSGMGGSPVPGMTPDPMGSTSGMGGSPSPGMGGTTSPYGMMSDAEMGMLQGLTGSAFDREFLTMMIGHHQGAIALARTEKAAGQYRPATDLARSIETSQTGEVTEMQTLLAQI